MPDDDIRDLLGRYATGSLSGAERRRLFDAALEDQDLFDQLSHEHSLKQLLDAPGARDRLIASLTPAPAPASSWTKNLIWAVAAVFVIGMSLTAMLIMRNSLHDGNTQIAQVSVPENPPTGEPAASPTPTPAVPDSKTAPPRQSTSADSVTRGKGATTAAAPQPKDLATTDGQLARDRKDAPAPASPPSRGRSEDKPKQSRQVDELSTAQAGKLDTATPVASAPPPPPAAVQETRAAPRAASATASAGLAGGVGGAAGGGGGRARAVSQSQTAAPSQTASQPQSDARTMAPRAQGVQGTVADSNGALKPAFSFQYSVEDQEIIFKFTADGYFSLHFVPGGTTIVDSRVTAGSTRRERMPNNTTEANVIFSARRQSVSGGIDVTTYNRSDTLTDPDGLRIELLLRFYH